MNWNWLIYGLAAVVIIGCVWGIYEYYWTSPDTDDKDEDEL